LKPKPKQIVIGENEILFYNNDRNISKKMLRKHDRDVDTTVSFYGYEKVSGIQERYSYQSIDDKFLTVGHSLNGTSGATHQVKLLEKKVYNHSGDFITTINPYHFMVVSDDANFFASYYEGEASGDTLIIYNSIGETKCKHYATSDASVGFLPGQNLLGIEEAYERSITILNPHCEKEVNIDLKKLNIGPVSTYFYSVKSKQILLSNPHKVELFNMEKGLVWSIEGAFVQKCIFLDNKKELLIIIWGGRIELDNQYQLKLINISNGEIKEALYADEVLYMDNNYFIIRKGGRYYEYALR
jgi:hypothetical protein